MCAPYGGQPFSRRSLQHIVAGRDKEANDRDFSPAAARFGAAARNTTRSISPGADTMDAVPRRAASQAASDHRYRSCPALFHIADGREYVEMQWRAQRIGLPRPGRLAIAAKVDCEHCESGGFEGLRLLPPAAFVELPAVREHDSARGIAVEIGVNAASILRGEGKGLLRTGEAGQCHHHHNRGKCGPHGASIPV